MRLGGLNLNEGGLGGWDLVNVPADKLPQRLATAIVAVNMNLFGASYLPIRLVGTQVVNGMNYMVLCKQTLVTEHKTTNIVLAIINVPAGDITGKNATLVDVIKEAELPAEVKDAFDAAVGQLLGVNYTPLLYFGSQVVKGINYYILCEATGVYPNAVPEAVVMGVNAFEGTYSVVSIEPVSAFDDKYGSENLEAVEAESLSKPLGEWP